MSNSSDLSGGETDSVSAPPSSLFKKLLQVLILMTIALMALGAGVRTMGAGLACPDWPLCFGKVIPDFHVGVYFEFIHRAIAGAVSLFFLAICIYIFRSKLVPAIARKLAIMAMLVLLAQIVMGGLTVLKLLKVGIVTSHLMLATLFLSFLSLIYFFCFPQTQKPTVTAPSVFKIWALCLPVFVFAQILLGGLVASSYAGSVCVDFPLCHGQWVPTLSGPLGLQVMHRFGAYFVAAVIFSFATFLHFSRNEKWMTNQIRTLALLLMSVIILQICVGAANVLFLIPASVTVLHQSMAMLLLLLTYRMAFVASRVSATSEYPAAHQARLF